MRKELILFFFLLVLSFNAFSSQVDNVNYDIQSVSKISFVTTFNTISESGINRLIEKYSVSALEPYNKQFLAGAGVFTVLTGVFLVMGIGGSVLFVIGWYGGLLWLGAVLMIIGWSAFNITLIGMIAFWILYRLSRGPKGAMKNIRIEGSTVAIKL